MKLTSTLTAFATIGLFATSAYGAPAALDVSLNAIPDGGSISPEYAFCQPDAKAHTKDGGNVSPEIKWSAGPEGTKSYAIVMHDTDVPTVFDDANKEDKTLPQSMPRRNFYHWILVDIPADITSLAKGADSEGVNKKGKPPGRQRYGVRGINDFGGFLNGTFAGYDGPCPPWNDEALHHYHFTVYALDVPSLGLTGTFGGDDVVKALASHVLAQGTVTGTYTQNPKVKK